MYMSSIEGVTGSSIVVFRGAVRLRPRAWLIATCSRYRTGKQKVA
jgi:hypothetical protein